MAAAAVSVELLLWWQTTTGKRRAGGKCAQISVNGGSEFVPDRHQIDPNISFCVYVRCLSNGFPSCSDSSNYTEHSTEYTLTTPNDRKLRISILLIYYWFNWVILFFDRISVWFSYAMLCPVHSVGCTWSFCLSLTPAANVYAVCLSAMCVSNVSNVYNLIWNANNYLFITFYKSFTFDRLVHRTYFVHTVCIHHICSHLWRWRCRNFDGAP